MIINVKLYWEFLIKVQNNGNEDEDFLSIYDFEVNEDEHHVR